MSPEKSVNKSEKIKKISSVLAYNMGHILYMAQLRGNIEKENLIDSVPKHERERYKEAFEALVDSEMLIPLKKGKKNDLFFINSKQLKPSKELINRFVIGTKGERRAGSEREVKGNPFFHRGPIKDADHFIGRGEIISHIFDRLRHLEDCSIIGPRAIGKTSLLHYISNDEVLRSYHLEPRKFIFVYYDLQQLGKSRDVSDFYYEVFSRAVNQLMNLDIMTDDEIQKINEEAGNILKKGSKTLFEFGDIEALLGILAERDFRIVYMFDEFEFIASNPTFDYSFYGQLRAISGNPNFKVALITASKKSIYDLTFDDEVKTSPFFRYFEDFRLGPLRDDELEGFYEIAAKNGVIFNDNVMDLIKDWSGGHPFLTQLACDYFYDLLSEGKELESEKEEKYMEIFLRKHMKHFSYFWRQVDEAERECLWKLASGQEIDAHCEEVFRKLEEGYLVVKEEGKYKVFSSAFEMYVREVGG